MTQIDSDLGTQTRTGLGLLPIAVAGLFLYVLWISSGMGIKFSADNVEKMTQLSYQELEQRAAGNASITEQIIWVFIGAVGLYLQLVKKNLALFTWSRAWPLVLLLALIALSVLWSSVPDIAVRRIVKHLLLVSAMAGVAVGAESPREILRLAVVFTGLMMVINCASVIVLPGVAIDDGGHLKGMFGHKNTAGQFAMVTVFFWFVAARWSQGTWMRTALVLGTLTWFLFLIGTDSRTSILAAVLSILIVAPAEYCLRKPQAGVIIAFFAIFIFFCAIFVLVMYNISFSNLMDDLEGEKTTLTGRTVVWSIAYKVFLDHKLLGTGFGSLFSTGGAPPAEQYSDLPLTAFLVSLTQAHSGYFELLATFGLAGVILFLVFMASVVRTEIRAIISSSGDRDSRALAELTGIVLVGSLIYNLAQTTFLQNDILWIILMLCYLLLCSKQSPNGGEPYSTPEEAAAPASRPRPSHSLTRRNRQITRPTSTAAKARITN